MYRWENYFCQLLNGVIDRRHTEIHTADSFVPEVSLFAAEDAVQKMKKYKFPGGE